MNSKELSLERGNQLLSEEMRKRIGKARRTFQAYDPRWLGVECHLSGEWVGSSWRQFHHQRDYENWSEKEKYGKV